MAHFLTTQRAILKVYLINMIEQKRSYGRRYLDYIKSQVREYGYEPRPSEIYKALHELTDEGVIYRTKRLKEFDEGLQEVVLYSFAENGFELAQRYKKLVKDDLERSKKLINKILKDNYS